MVLDGQRDNVDPLLNSIARRLVNINPNVLSWLSLVFAFLAGIFFYLSSPEKELENYFLYFAVLFVFLNGFFEIVAFTPVRAAAHRNDFILFTEICIISNISV